MTQTLQDKVAEAIERANEDCATGMISRGANEAHYVADAALQAVAAHIGVTVDKLERGKPNPPVYDDEDEPFDPMTMRIG